MPSSPPCLVIAPDSFKGSLTALQAAQAMAAGIRRVWPEAKLHLHQKGMAAVDVARFDQYLARLGELGDQATGQNLSALPGSGAAGGLGWALQLLGGRLLPGADRLADLQGLDASLQGADWLITGEGRSDAQTLLGKVPWRMAERAAHFGVPAVLVSGDIDHAALPGLRARFGECVALVEGETSQARALQEAASLLADRMEHLGRVWKTAK